MNHELDRIRDAIDRIDAQILTLAQARARLVAEAWAYKRAHDLPLQDPERERQLLDHLQRLNHGSGLAPQVVERLFRALIAQTPHNS